MQLGIKEPAARFRRPGKGFPDNLQPLIGRTTTTGFCRKSGVGTRERQVFVTRSCSEQLELLGE